MNWSFAKPELTQWLDLTQICFPDEDLSALITALHAEPDDVAVLMAQANGAWVAMGCLTQCKSVGRLFHCWVRSACTWIIKARD